LAEFLGDKPACDVTMCDLRAWLESLHGDYAASTIGRKLACVRSFFRFGKREKWAREDPARELEPGALFLNRA
jgi:site-specific recombinase XerD